jgi:hypothetical protein
MQMQRVQEKNAAVDDESMQQKCNACYAMHRMQQWIDATFFAYYATTGGIQQNAVYYTPWMPLQHIGNTMQRR